jgi:hypothetical protein
MMLTNWGGVRMRKGQPGDGYAGTYVYSRRDGGVYRYDPGLLRAFSAHLRIPRIRPYRMRWRNVRGTA